MSEIVKFQGTVIRNVYNTEDFKIYAMCVDQSKFPFLKLNEYGNIAICGNLHTLNTSIDYTITAKEKINNRGIMYEVINISREKPLTEDSALNFLSEIIPYQQAQVLLNVYPDIIQRIMDHRLEDIDLSRTKGIKEKTFEKIRQKVINNFCIAELVEELGGLLEFQVLRKLYDKYPSTKKVKSELSKNPYKCLCGISGIGFQTADIIIQEMDRKSKTMITNNQEPSVYFDFDVITSSYRLQSCIIYLLEENEKEGHTYIELQELKELTRKYTPECYDKFIDTLKEMKDDMIKINQIGNVFRLSTYLKSVYISHQILNAIEQKNIWNIDTAKYQGDLTNKQFSLLKTICNHQITILSGYAGTGKSYTTTQLIQMMDKNNKTYYIFSPTGRASKVIGEYTKRPSSTIHRGLGYRPPNEWIYNNENHFRVDLIIVDEFSMVDVHLFFKLIQAINFNQTKLLIIGDPEQLPSVGCGNLLFDLIESHQIPTIQLTEVFRYGKGGIDTVATNIRNMKPYLNDGQSIQVYGEDKGFTYIPSTDEAIIHKLITVYKKLLASGILPENIGVLSAYNKGSYGAVAINKFLQKIANKDGINSGQSIEYGNTTFYPNDLILQTINNYQAKKYVDILDDNKDTTYVFNGEIGKAKKIQKQNLVIEFDEEIIYSKDQLSTIKLGYSISCHKSQGGSFDYVIFLTPKNHSFMLNSNLLYVGITRTKKKCFQIGDYHTISHVIKKKINRTRKTEMKYLLENTILTKEEMLKFQQKLIVMLKPKQ